MAKKYEFTGEEKEFYGRTVKRIRRLSDGLLGGWIEKEENLSHEGDCFIFDEAVACDNSRVVDSSVMGGNSAMMGNSQMRDNSAMMGWSELKGKGVLSQQQRISSGVCYTDLSKNLKESIRCQTGLLVVGDKVIAYKQIKKDRSSFRGSSFVYPTEGFVEVEAEESDYSCAAGLHFSTANYWNLQEDPQDSLTIAAEIDINDIVTVQEGKIRCRRARILG